eukprot:gb/GEZN01010998.1/.p1 GENE.gb/GEZN01010998.1/~~gb/GEZN01010998.1/.p1  ORF type:complete len:220 (+),score=76.21 gb/GEZN01010998.1/:24-683(+)
MSKSLWWNAARGVYQEGSLMAAAQPQDFTQKPGKQETKHEKKEQEKPTAAAPQPKKEQQQKKQPEPKKPEPKKAAKKEESEEEADEEDDEEKGDDDFDLDDSDDDEETKAMLAAKSEEIKAIQARQQAKAGDAKSNLTLDIKPYDSETDMREVEKKVRAINLEGCKWLGGQLIDVAYGVKKLRIMCQLVDVLINPDTIREAVEKLDEVQSTDIFAFQMA